MSLGKIMTLFQQTQKPDRANAGTLEAEAGGALFQAIQGCLFETLCQETPQAESLYKKSVDSGSWRCGSAGTVPA